MKLFSGQQCRYDLKLMCGMRWDGEELHGSAGAGLMAQVFEPTNGAGCGCVGSAKWCCGATTLCNNLLGRCLPLRRERRAQLKPELLAMLLRSQRGRISRAYQPRSCQPAAAVPRHTLPAAHVPDHHHSANAAPWQMRTMQHHIGGLRAAAPCRQPAGPARKASDAVLRLHECAHARPALRTPPALAPPQPSSRASSIPGSWARCAGVFRAAGCGVYGGCFRACPRRRRLSTLPSIREVKPSYVRIGSI